MQIVDFDVALLVYAHEPVSVTVVCHRNVSAQFLVQWHRRDEPALSADSPSITSSRGHCESSIGANRPAIAAHEVDESGVGIAA